MSETWRRWYKDLDIKSIAHIISNRLQNPLEEDGEFAKKNNITTIALRKIQETVNFDKEIASNAVLANILEKDRKLINLSTDIKNKWAEQVWRKKQIWNKDIETLDRIENTSMKRAALLNKWEESDSWWYTVTVNL